MSDAWGRRVALAAASAAGVVGAHGLVYRVLAHSQGLAHPHAHAPSAHGSGDMHAWLDVAAPAALLVAALGLVAVLAAALRGRAVRIPARSVVSAAAVAAAAFAAIELAERAAAGVPMADLADILRLGLPLAAAAVAALAAAIHAGGAVVARLVARRRPAPRAAAVACRPSLWRPSSDWRQSVRPRGPPSVEPCTP